jgi:Glycosyltransferase
MSPSASKRFKVAVLFSSAEGEGGAFVQSLNIAKAFAPEVGDDYDIEYVAVDKSDKSRLLQAGYAVAASSNTSARAVFGILEKFPALKALLRRVYLVFFGSKNNLDKLARENGYDLLVFVSNSRLALGVMKTPFIYTVWDLCHLDHPEFPEFTDDNAFSWRQALYSSVLPRASAYIVDTPSLARKVADAYNVNAEKALLLPYCVSDELLQAAEAAPFAGAIREKYGITAPFVYYPAQFWPHKNHAYILRALALLNEQGEYIEAVFSGTDRGSASYVKDVAARYGVEGQVKFVGFIPTEDLVALYRASIALVMPSFFGPTNIPPLEAEALGCHLIYSDLPGYREFAGDDCYYCDLARPESLAELILTAKSVGPRNSTKRLHDAEAVKASIRKVIGMVRAKRMAWSS